MMLEQPNLRADPNVMALPPALGSRTLIIKTVDDYECAALVLRRAKTSIDIIEQARLKITGPLNEALKAANAQAKAAKAPYLEEEDIIKAALLAFDDEQDEIRAAEQRRANEEADREQRRLQAIADEARAKADADAKRLRDEAEAAAAAGHAKEAEKLLGKADRIELKGDEKAELYADRASQVVAVVSDRQAPRVAGITIPKVYDFEVTNADLVPLEYRPVDEKLIRKVVTALKGLTKIPGVRVFERKRIAAGRA